jgi:hypothetical protein
VKSEAVTQRWTDNTMAKKKKKGQEKFKIPKM